MQVTFGLVVLLACGTAARGQGAAARFEIRGSVVDAETGAPLFGAEVTLETTDGQRETRAGGDGKFVFVDLPAGKYPISAEAPGHVRAAYNEHFGFSTGIVVGPNVDPGGVTIRLHGEAIIYGRVTDERGDSVRRAQVTLLSEGGLGRHDVQGRLQVTTNDLGAYRFAHLPAGKYYVVVQAKPWYAESGPKYLPEQPFDGRIVGSHLMRARRGDFDPLLDVVYPVTFFPGVSDEESASALELKPGETEEANIALAAVPAIHLRVAATKPAGEQMQQSFSAYRKVFGTAPINLEVQSVEIAPGDYEVMGMAPGEMTLSMTRWGPAGRMPTMEAIELKGADGGTVDVDRARTSAKISGRVVMPQGVEVPANSRISLSAEGRQVARAPIEKDGTFTIAAAPTGDANVRVLLNGAGGWFIHQMSATGAAASGRHLLIEGAGDVTLRVVMAKGIGTVAGVAKLNGQAVSGMMVLLVPNPVPNEIEDWWRMDQSDSDGSFKMGNIVPGKYWLMAIRDGWDLEWMKAGVLKPYLERAQAVEVGAEKVTEVTAVVQERIK